MTHDENRPWRSNRGQSSDMQVRDEAILGLAPPIKQAIDDFNTELNTLLRFLDGGIARKHERERQDLSSSFATPRAFSLGASASLKTPFRQREPPSSTDRMSPMRTGGHSTPVRRRGPGSHTPSEQPPAPVETPGYHGLPTPNRHRNRRVDESFNSRAPSESAPRNSMPTQSSTNDQDYLHRIIKE